jgi:hypothetical protein
MEDQGRHLSIGKCLSQQTPDDDPGFTFFMGDDQRSAFNSSPFIIFSYRTENIYQFTITYRHGAVPNVGSNNMTHAGFQQAILSVDHHLQLSLQYVSNLLLRVLVQRYRASFGKNDKAESALFAM